jgi:hypothetical protein
MNAVFIKSTLTASGAAILTAAIVAHAASRSPLLMPTALYPADTRHIMTSADYARYPGAGVLFCRDENGVAHKAAASWLIGRPGVVMMNAHNFRDRQGEVTRAIEDCFFQIGGKNYDFEAQSLELGVPAEATALHITDDWALAGLRDPIPRSVVTQPVPKAPLFATGSNLVAVTMVSPAGHSNFIGASSIESCSIHEIDPPSEDFIRRARHDCNDGFGGSGSGLFDEAGHLVAMQSASLDMNRRLAFDVGLHYGSALLIEGKLLEAIKRRTGEP